MIIVCHSYDVSMMLRDFFDYICMCKIVKTLTIVELTHEQPGGCPELSRGEL